MLHRWSEEEISIDQSPGEFYCYVALKDERHGKKDEGSEQITNG